METVAYLSLVVASISFTIAETRLFAPCRRWANRISTLLGKLLSCGYCTGHWIAFALVAVYRPRLFQCWWPLDYFLTALVIAWIGGLQWAVMCLLMKLTEK